MNQIELEQLKENLATKIGILELKMKRGELADDYMELVHLYKNYEEHGTTIEELKLLNADVYLALQDREVIDSGKSRRELELEKIILEMKTDAIELRYILENSVLVKNKAIEKVETIIAKSEGI